jgi:hypothetical protein
MTFLEGERPSKKRSSRSFIALPPLFPTDISSQKGKRPIEGGVQGTRTKKPYILGLGFYSLEPKAVGPVENPEEPNSSIRIGSLEVGIFL